MESTKVRYSTSIPFLKYNDILRHVAKREHKTLFGHHKYLSTYHKYEVDFDD